MPCAASRVVRAACWNRETMQPSNAIVVNVADRFSLAAPGALGQDVEIAIRKTRDRKKFGHVLVCG